jgi:hypothetical protein
VNQWRQLQAHLIRWRTEKIRPQKESEVEEESETEGAERMSKILPYLIEEDPGRNDDADISKFFLDNERVCEF